MKRNNVSASVIKRLPRYYRFLGDLIDNHIFRISSKELAARMGITASQIRQDLNCFGGFGQQGYGYNVQLLHNEIAGILGLNRNHPTILIGAGNLGRAIANHMTFENKGFELTAIFDSNPELEGKTVKGYTIRSDRELASYCRAHHPECAILCIPRENAIDIAGLLVELGVKGFWNFTHYDLAINYPDVKVENVHLGDSLMTLAYALNSEDDGEESEEDPLSLGTGNFAGQ